jgi:hypothetical protein
MQALHPSIGIRDGDAVAYLPGAMSLAAGRGYTSLAGELLNHWAPGYSWLLHWFDAPLAAAQTVNYISAGVAAAGVCWLARLADWTRTQALGVTSAITFGFVRSFASNAAPDALAHAIFLWGVALVARRPLAMECRRPLDPSHPAQVDRNRRGARRGCC